ncbi:MAG: ParB/RepB/Spo0J family partition protein [Pseudomonadota bacterium]
MTVSQVKIRPQKAAKPNSKNTPITAKTKPRKSARPKARTTTGEPPKRLPAPSRPATVEAVQIIDVAKLHVSELNMRQGADAPDIADIYPSVLASGVNQSLLVRKEGDGFGVVAGRRRLFALRRKADETGDPVTAPCLVMQSGDDLAALEASLLENVARLPSTELEQLAAFKALSEAGETAKSIAVTFGLTELRVKRVLALADVHADILALYEAEEISQTSLRYMTMATKEQQAAWLELWRGEDYAPQESYLKEWLTGGASIATSAALFDLSDYPGHIISDLFGREEGSGYFQDADLFWTHQNRAIAEKADTLRAKGWADVVILERGKSLDSWDYSDRERRAGGKVFIEVGHDGSVRIREGLLHKADIARIDAIIRPNDTSAKAAASMAKPEMSGPVADYVRLHRYAIVSASLLDAPGVALRVAVAHMLVGSPQWTCEPTKTTSRKESTSDSVANSLSAKRVAEERRTVFDSLGLEEDTPAYGAPKHLTKGDFAAVFASLLGQDDATVLRVLALAMSVTLTSDEAVVEAVCMATQPDVPALWEPDEAFFDLLRDKRVINVMLADIGGKSLADSLVTESGTKQKAALCNRFGGQGVSADLARPDWRPRWMQTVPQAYLDRKTCPPAQAATMAAKQLGGRSPKTKRARKRKTNAA